MIREHLSNPQSRMMQRLCLCVFSCMFLVPAHAERVSVVSSHGSHGQGWLFGAQAYNQITQCWLAVPAHVVRSESTGKAAAVRFTDGRGYTVESDLPTTLDNVEGAEDILGREVDLAFAKVKGRLPDSCLSRLGLPEMVYQSLMRKAPTVQFFDMLDTSFGVFDLAIRKGQVDAFGGGLMALGTSDVDIVNTHFNQGLSGAIGTVQWQDKQYPFAMVSRIDPSKQIVLAVRFDVIRALFKLVDTSEESKPIALDKFSIIGLRIDPTSSTLAASSLMTSGECRTASPAKGGRLVELLIETMPDMKALRGVSLLQDNSCDATPFVYSVDQRPDAKSNWVKVGDCNSTNLITNNCRMDLRTPRQIRIRIDTNNPVVISGLQLY